MTRTHKYKDKHNSPFFYYFVCIFAHIAHDYRDVKVTVQ